MINKNKVKKNFITPIIISSILIILLSITISMVVYQLRDYTDTLIIKDLTKLNEIFIKINQTAGILSFEQDKMPIDFLNVEKFEGSQLGGMNLAKPQKWKGPYLISNPKIQDRFFQVIKTNKGYFIVPGDGVKLSNKKVIGKDIILNKDSDIKDMMKDNNQLAFKNISLAHQIPTVYDFVNNEIDLTLDDGY